MDALRVATAPPVSVPSPAPRPVAPVPQPEAIAAVPSVPRQSSRWVWGVLLGLLAVLVVGIVGYVVGTQIGKPTLTPIVTPFTPATTIATLPGETPTLPISSAEPTPGIGSTRTRTTDGMTIVYVPAGTFKMGSDGGNDAEKPAHDVKLDAFWIDRTEVTNAQYAQCVAAGKCDAPSETKSSTRDSYYGNSQYDNYPVIGVSWFDADKYCKWAGGQLPTEAQWEYAARGPNAYAYPWGNDPPDKERLISNLNSDDTTAVGSYPQGASWVGALDLAGNVWEWVNDWYGPYPASAQTNPTGPASGDYRVLRGGSWHTAALYARVTFRLGDAPDGRNDNQGFRCVLPFQ